MNRSSRRKTLSHSEIENFLNEISNVNKDQVNDVIKLQEKENILHSSQQQENKDPLHHPMSTKFEVIPSHDAIINLEEQSIREFCKLTFAKSHYHKSLESSANLCTIGRNILNITNYPIITRRLLKPELYLHAPSSLEAKKTLLLALSPMLSEAEEERVKESTACEAFTRCKSSKGKSKFSFFDYIDIDTQTKVSYSEYENRYLMYIAQNKKTYSIKLNNQTHPSINYLTSIKSNQISHNKILTPKNPTTSHTNTMILSPTVIVNNSCNERKFTIPKGVYQYSNQENVAHNSQVINNQQLINHQSLSLVEKEEHNNNLNIVNSSYPQDHTLHLLASIMNNSSNNNRNNILNSNDINMTSDDVSDIQHSHITTTHEDIIYNNNIHIVQDRKRKHSKQIISRRETLSPETARSMMLDACCVTDDSINLHCNTNRIIEITSPIKENITVVNTSINCDRYTNEIDSNVMGASIEIADNVCNTTDLDIRMMKSFGEELDSLLCDDIPCSYEVNDVCTAMNEVQEVQDSSVHETTSTSAMVCEEYPMEGSEVSDDSSGSIVIVDTSSSESVMDNMSCQALQSSTDAEILNNHTTESTVVSQIPSSSILTNVVTQVISENLMNTSTTNIINESNNLVEAIPCKESSSNHINDSIIDNSINHQEEEQHLPLISTLCSFKDDFDNSPPLVNSICDYIQANITTDNVTSAMELTIDTTSNHQEINSPFIKSKSIVLISSPLISLAIKPPSPPTSIPSFTNPSPLQKRIGSGNKYYTSQTYSTSTTNNSHSPIEYNKFDVLNSIQTPVKSFQLKDNENEHFLHEAEDINKNNEANISLIQNTNIKIITMNEEQYDSPTSYSNKSMDDATPNSLVDFYRKQIIPEEEIMDSDLETFEILESLVEKEYLSGMICQWGEYQTSTNSNSIDTHTNSYENNDKNNSKEECNNIPVDESIIIDTTNILYVTEQQQPQCDNLQSLSNEIPPSIDMKVLEEQAELRLKYRTETAYWQYKWEIVSGDFVNKIIQNKINQLENNNS